MLSHPSDVTSLINTLLLVCAIVVMGVMRVIDVTESRERWIKVEEFIDAHNEYHKRCQHPIPLED